MIGWLLTPFHWLNRRMDMLILWPEICKQTTDHDRARGAFYFHVSRDRAWTDHYSETELIAFVHNLGMV